MKIVDFRDGRYIDTGRYHYYEKSSGEIFPLDPITANYFLMQENYTAVSNYLNTLHENSFGYISLTKLLEEVE
ncbi:MAG: hypothetical protein PWQ06_1665 [Anaerophaga sp.]|nr:hypothetical protein [Anaerophaga sp.]